MLRNISVIVLFTGALFVGESCNRSDPPPPSAQQPHVHVEIYPPYPPPVPQVEVIGVAPYPGYFWIEGHWGWVGTEWVWTPGRWEARPHRWAVYERGFWEHHDDGYHWHEGHWGEGHEHGRGHWRDDGHDRGNGSRGRDIGSHR